MTDMNRCKDCPSFFGRTRKGEPICRPRGEGKAYVDYCSFIERRDKENENHTRCR